MAAEVTVAGHKFARWQVWAVIGGGVLVTGWIIYKHKSGPGAASSSASGTDPVTGLPYSQDNTVDPATGMTYLAEAQQYGSVAAAENASYGAGYGYGGYSGTGYGVTGSPYPVSGSQSVQGYGDNAQWAQAAEAGLTDIGYSATDVAAALGAYLASQPLTASEASIVRAALAEYGSPPTGSFQVLQAPPTATADVTVPYVVGQELVWAQRDIGYAGLKSSFSGPAAKPGQTRVVTTQSPVGGAKAAKGSNVQLAYKIQ